jgi:Ca2+-transporting ATPase
MNTGERGVPGGLSSEEAARRLALEGPNELPRPPRRTAWRILLEVAREPMFQLLGAAVAIYLVLGDVSEAGVLLAFLGVIVAITLVQERRTERVLEALHDMTSPRALVRRDGQPRRVAGTELVRGDTIELAEGDRVPADAQLLEANDLAIDESLLSGESLPLAKGAPAPSHRALRRWCTPGHWWLRAGAWPGSRPLARAARSGASARCWERSRRKRRPCTCRHGNWCAGSRCSAWR